MVRKKSTPGGPAASDPSRVASRSFGSASDLIEAMLGERPTLKQERAVAWYEELRQAARACREAAGMTQAEFADHTGCQQSEVSRLERGLGPMTAIGRIKSHIEESGGRFEWTATDCNGRSHSSASAAGEQLVLAVLANHQRRSVRGRAKRERRAVQEVEMSSALSGALAAMEKAMSANHIDSATREKVLITATRQLGTGPLATRQTIDPQSGPNKAAGEVWSTNPAPKATT